ncbi:MAG TPA: hypothetical protein VMA77_33505 [Solirubrobacteraceae bacterium]|nr:hypothetical protein [Solirubrobacteraceae bacterium]
MSSSWLALLGVGAAAGAGAAMAPPAVAAAVAVPRPARAAHQMKPSPTLGVAGDPGPASPLSIGGSALNAGKQLVTGNVSGAAGTLAGGAAGAVVSTASTALGLAAIGTLTVGAAHGVLNYTAAALGATTSPQLRTTWFSSAYWRMAAIAALLTLPFLFAAAVQALIRSDVALLARAAFGYLPLAMLAVAIAAPLTSLVLAACDQLCSFVSSAASNESAHFLAKIGLYAAAPAAFGGSPFLAFLVGLFIIAAAFALWVELLLREAAVYVIVLMLPLAFAAFVWPARRIWAIRAVELLVALILSKFAIVAVLSLGGAAVGAAGHNVTTLMGGGVLIMLATFSPWALMRLLPLAELATGAVEPLRGGLRTPGAEAVRAGAKAATREDEWVARAAAMKREAEAGMVETGRPSAPPGTTGSGVEPRAATGATGSGQATSASADESQPAEGDEPPDPVATRWSEQRVLGLDGEDLGSPPVHPHPDAE